MEALSLASSSAGNCLALRSAPGQPIILVDAGIPKAAIFEGLRSRAWAPEEIAAICVTHEHIDHVAGLRGLAQNLRTVPIFMSRGTYAKLPWINSSFPVRLMQGGDRAEIVSGVQGAAVAIAHDAIEPLAFTFTDQAGDKAAVVVDLGTIDDDVRMAAADADLVFVESNYDRDMLAACEYRQSLRERIAGPLGHLSNEQLASDLIPVLGAVQALVLGHISSRANLPRLAALHAQIALDRCGTAAQLFTAGAEPGHPITV